MAQTRERGKEKEKEKEEKEEEEEKKKEGKKPLVTETKTGTSKAVQRRVSPWVRGREEVKVFEGIKSNPTASLMSVQLTNNTSFTPRLSTRSETWIIGGEGER